MRKSTQPERASTRWASLLVAPLLGSLALCACDTPTSAVSDAMPEGGVQFADVGGLTDGATIREDALTTLPDAIVLNDAGEICRSGGVTGVACAPDGTGIIDAIVEAATEDCDGNPVIRRVRTDERGRFELGDLAVGPITVTIRSGNFRNEFQATIRAGTIVPAGDAISDKICLESDAARIGVVTGDYDRISNILGGLGFDFQLVCGGRRDHRAARQALSDPNLGAAFDVLFFNCASGINFRHTNPEVDAIKANLRRFVAGGGSVYVSDLAADVIEQVWPEMIDFELVARPAVAAPDCCVCADCPPECLANTPTTCDLQNDLPVECATGAGVAGRGMRGTVEGRIVPEFLQQAVGSEAFDVVFNLGGWMQMNAVAAEVEVLVAAPDGAPLMVLFEPSPGGGRVAYTSFHTHTQATEEMRAILAALALRL